MLGLPDAVSLVRLLCVVSSLGYAFVQVRSTCSVGPIERCLDAQELQRNETG
jgi:hypothetical protein